MGIHSASDIKLFVRIVCLHHLIRRFLACMYSLFYNFGTIRSRAESPKPILQDCHDLPRTGLRSCRGWSHTPTAAQFHTAILQTLKSQRQANLLIVQPAKCTKFLFWCSILHRLRRPRRGKFRTLLQMSESETAFLPVLKEERPSAHST